MDKLSPDSFVKHTDMDDESPSNDSTPTKDAKEGNVENDDAIEDETKDKGTNDDGIQKDDSKAEDAEEYRFKERPQVQDHANESHDKLQHVKNNHAGEAAFQSLVRAHRIDVLELKEQHDEEIKALKQDHQDGITFWKRKHEIETEKHATETAGSTKKIADLEEAHEQNSDIFGAELLQLRDEREKLQTQVQKLKTERHKIVNKALQLNKASEQQRKALEQEKRESVKQKKASDTERKNLETAMKAKGKVHEAEVLKLKEEHEKEADRLRKEAEAERETSKRKMSKLKAALKDLEAYLEKEQKKYDTASESAETTHRNELDDLKEQQEFDLKWAKNDFQEKLDKEKAALRTCRGLKKSLETKLEKAKKDLSDAKKHLTTLPDEWRALDTRCDRMTKSQATLSKGMLKNDSQGLTLDQLKPQVVESTQQPNENKPNPASTAQEERAQLQQSLSDLQKNLNRVQAENTELSEALNVGKEDWQVERKRLYKAKVQAQVDYTLLATENEDLRADYEIDPVRKSQWEKLIGNKDAVCKRLEKRHAEDQEKIYKMQITVQITNEKMKEEAEALMLQMMTDKELIKDLMRKRESFRETSEKMLGILTQQAQSQQADGLAAIVERSKLLEQDNQDLLMNIQVSSAKLHETRKLLVASQHENIVFKQDLKDKTAACEELQRNNGVQGNDIEWLKMNIDELLPKQHAERIGRRDARIADLEELLTKTDRRVQALAQLKADKGLHIVLQDKELAIAELNTQLDKVCEVNRDLGAQYDALFQTTVHNQEFLNTTKESQDRDALRAAVAEAELHRLRKEMANGNKKLCNPQKWANWHSWHIACLHAQNMRKEAEQTANSAMEKANGLDKLAKLLWRRVFGFENLVGPSLCPARLSETRAEVVDLSTKLLGFNANDIDGDTAAAMDVKEVQETGNYRGPRFAPARWVLAGACESDTRCDTSAAGTECGPEHSGVEQEPSLEHVNCVIIGVLDQWDEKLANLDAAVCTTSSPATPKAKCQSKGKGPDPELYDQAQLDTFTKTKCADQQFDDESADWQGARDDTEIQDAADLRRQRAANETERIWTDKATQSATTEAEQATATIDGNAGAQNADPRIHMAEYRGFSQGDSPHLETTSNTAQPTDVLVNNAASGQVNNTFLSAWNLALNAPSSTASFDGSSQLGVDAEDADDEEAGGVAI